MKRVCPGWFGVHADERLIEDTGDEDVLMVEDFGVFTKSHGMCKDCEEAAERDWNQDEADQDAAEVLEEMERNGPLYEGPNTGASA